MLCSTASNPPDKLDGSVRGSAALHGLTRAHARISVSLLPPQALSRQPQALSRQPLGERTEMHTCMQAHVHTKQGTLLPGREPYSPSVQELVLTNASLPTTPQYASLYTGSEGCSDPLLPGYRSTADSQWLSAPVDSPFLFEEERFIDRGGATLVVPCLTRVCLYNAREGCLFWCRTSFPLEPCTVCQPVFSMSDFETTVSPCCPDVTLCLCPKSLAEPEPAVLVESMKVIVSNRLTTGPKLWNDAQSPPLPRRNPSKTSPEVLQEQSKHLETLKPRGNNNPGPNPRLEPP